MTEIDWPTLVNWIIKGLISFIFGVVGGFIGSWFKFSLESKREKEQEKKEVRDRLLAGVNEFVEKTQRVELEKINIDKNFKMMLPSNVKEIRVRSLVISVIILFYSLIFLWRYPPFGIFLLLSLGILIGIRVRKK